MRNRIAGGDTKTTRKGRRRGKINVTGGEGTATRTIRLFSSILSYAVDMELIREIPPLASGSSRADSGIATCLRMSFAGWERFLKDQRPRQPRVLPPSSCACSSLQVRRGEIEGLKWSEVDFNFGMLRKKTSKTGAKVIPLARVADEDSRGTKTLGRSQPALGFSRASGRRTLRWSKQGMAPHSQACWDRRRCAFTTCGTPLQAWVRAVAWGCRSLEEFSGIVRLQRRSDTLTWLTDLCVQRPT